MVVCRRQLFVRHAPGCERRERGPAEAVDADGETLWAFRYSSEGRSRSLFHSTDISTLRAQYPDNPVLHRLSDDARVVVSEPLGGLRGAWREVPESTCVVVRNGQEEQHPFAPTVLSPVG